MIKMSLRATGTALILAAASANPALAIDPVCIQLKSITQMLKNKPFHLYVTETKTFPNPKLATAAGQIGMGGTKQSEEISTGKDIYVFSGGRWIDMKTSFAAMTDDKESDPDAKKALEDSRCKVLADEIMYNQPTSVYLQSVPALGIETKMWISKSTHFPVRTDMTNDQGAMKILSVSRYEYDGVQAPDHAVTMQEVVKSAGGR
jgi:hypothetical protein